MHYRKRQTPMLSLKVQSNMPSSSIQTADYRDPSSLILPGRRFVARQEKQIFTALSPRPKPLLSNTFGPSSTSRPPDTKNSPSIDDSPPSAILLSISPTFIDDTFKISSPSSPTTAVPANHYKYTTYAKIFGTQPNPLHLTRHDFVKDFNLSEFHANQNQNGSEPPVLVARSSDASRAASDYSCASHPSCSALSISTVATSPKSYSKESASLNQDLIPTVASSFENLVTHDQSQSSLPFSEPAKFGLSRASSCASILSLFSASDHHLKFRSPTSWPIPPSSSRSLAPPNGPRKAATYHPLRSMLSRPSCPYPMNLMNTQSSSTLAYLDLSSAPRLVESASADGDQSSLTLESIQLECLIDSNQLSSKASSTLKRVKSPMRTEFFPISKLRSSQCSLRSDITAGTVYEDALEETEWMDIDSGDAYDDLEKTEASARRISQTLTMMNGVGVINRRTSKAQLRQPARFPKARSQGSAKAIPIPLVPRRSNYSLPTSRQLTMLLDHTSPSSQEIPSSESSSPSFHDDKDDTTLSRLRDEFEQLFMGSVPLFTRMSVMRNDKDKRCSLQSPGQDQLSRAVNLQPIQETSDPRNALTLTPVKASLPSTGNPRRRLKPLILRPAHRTLYPVRKRASTVSFKPLSTKSSLPGTNPLELSSSADLTTQSHMSHASPFSFGEAPTLPARHTLGSIKPIATHAEPLSHTAVTNDLTNTTFSSSLDSSLNLSPKPSESNSVLTAVEAMTNNGFKTSVMDADQISKSSSVTLFDTVTCSPHQTRDYIYSTKKSPIVSFAQKDDTLPDASLERYLASGISAHKRITSDDLPTLAAGSSNAARAQSPSINRTLDSTSSKRQIANLFTPKSISSASSSFAKRSLDSPILKEVYPSPNSKTTSQKRDSLVFDSKPKLTKVIPRLRGNSKLTITLARLEAQDGKLPNLDSQNKSPLRAATQRQDDKKFVKGKLTRISQPVLLSGEEERLALWGMISSSKPTSHAHR